MDIGKIAAWGLAALIVIIGSTVLLTGAHNPPTPALVQVSQADADELCGGPAIRDVREEPSGTVQVYDCSNGTFIPAYQ